MSVRELSANEYQLNGSAYTIDINLKDESVAYHLRDFGWFWHGTDYVQKKGWGDEMLGLLLARLAKSKASEDFRKDIQNSPAEVVSLLTRILGHVMKSDEGLYHIAYTLAGDNNCFKFGNCVWVPDYDDYLLSSFVFSDKEFAKMADVLDVDESRLRSWVAVEKGDELVSSLNVIDDVFDDDVTQKSIADMLQKAIGTEPTVLGFMDRVSDADLEYDIVEYLMDAAFEYIMASKDAVNKEDVLDDLADWLLSDVYKAQLTGKDLEAQKAELLDILKRILKGKQVSQRQGVLFPERHNIVQRMKKLFLFPK